MTADPELMTVLAHQSLATALPFVVPAVLVAALLGAVVWRDRHSEPPPEA